jgi:hypothetical protein
VKYFPKLIFFFGFFGFLVFPPRASGLGRRAVTASVLQALGSHRCDDLWG